MSLIPYTEPAPSLESLDVAELAAMANEEDRLVQEAVNEALSSLSDGLRHAMRCGELLVALQAKVNTHKWAQWVGENLAFRPKTAVAYVRVYTYREILPDTGMTLSAALTHLRGLPATGMRRGAPPKFENPVKEEARRLRSQGQTLREISEALDVNFQTVHLWTNDKALRRQKERAAKRSREATRALQAQRRQESVRVAGGSIRRAHDLVLKLTRELDAALANATDTDMRNALRSSYSAATRCESELLRALKLE